MKFKTSDDIWQRYEKGKNYHHRFNIYDDTAECWRFYEGDQWKGLKIAGDTPPILNIIAAIVDTKVSRVAQNGMTVNYSPISSGVKFLQQYELCKKLNAHAARMWEKMKFDSLMWDFITEMAVTGDIYVYFSVDDGDPNQISAETVDRTNIFLGDEQQADIQKQPYIIIEERKLISEVKKAAEANGLDEESILMISSDDDTENRLGDKARDEIKGDDDDGGKCTVLFVFWKENGIVHYCRSTKDVIYEPDTARSTKDTPRGSSLYPIAHCAWRTEKGSARGFGEALRLIPNQLEINKALARYLLILKQVAYPHVVYNKDVFKDTDITKLIGTIGSAIGLDDTRARNINELISYMQPGTINPQAYQIISELENKTRDLSSASDAALGITNPELASGAAITAVQDAQAVPLQRQSAAFKQFVEDVARIWFDLWVTYNPAGLKIILGEDYFDEAPEELQMQFGKEVDGKLVYDKDKAQKPFRFEETIPYKELAELNVDIKVDTSPATYYSKLAHELSLQNALNNQQISFEEYVFALPDNASAPKQKFEEILNKRKEEQDAITADAPNMQLPEQAQPMSDNRTIEEVSAEEATAEIQNIANVLGGNE